jgi:hypothetical protein
VLEMDARFIDQGQGTASIMFRDNGTAHYGANLSPQGWVGFHKNVNDVHIPLLETEIPTSSFQAWDAPKHLTLIARQDRMAFYVNGTLSIAFTDSSSSQGSFNFSVCVDSPLQVLIDNLKIWDLSGGDFSIGTETTTPAPTRKAEAFYEPILKYLETKRWATFEDDFSTQRTEWGYDSYGHLITEQIKSQSLQIPPAKKIPSNQLLYSYDFAVRYDYSLANSGPEHFEFRFRSSSDESAYYTFLYSKGGAWEFISPGRLIESGSFKPVSGSEIIFDLGTNPGDWSKIPLNNFFFIVQGKNLAVFINDDLVLEFSELEAYGKENYFFNQADTWYGKLDNFKFWNLDGVDFNP